VRAHAAAKEHQLKLIIGSEFTFVDGLRCVLLGNESQGLWPTLSLDHTRSTRGREGRLSTRMARWYSMASDDARSFLQDCLALWLPAADPDVEQGQAYALHFQIEPGLLSSCSRAATIASGWNNCARWALSCGYRSLPAANVHMHVRGRRALQDTMTAIRLGVPIQHAGLALFPMASVTCVLSNACNACTRRHCWTNRWSSLALSILSERAAL
jgi:error-prone DNA polymerase